jgi:hypothetical protein
MQQTLYGLRLLISRSAASLRRLNGPRHRGMNRNSAEIVTDVGNAGTCGVSFSIRICIQQPLHGLIPNCVLELMNRVHPLAVPKVPSTEHGRLG